MGGGPQRRHRITPGLAVTTVAVALVLAPAPTDAFRLPGVAAVADSGQLLKRKLDRAVELFDRMSGAVVAGDTATARKVEVAFERFGGELVIDGFMSTSALNNLRFNVEKMAKSADRKIRRIGRFLAGNGGGDTDMRIALVGGDDYGEVYKSRKPLPVVKVSPSPIARGREAEKDPWAADAGEDGGSSVSGADPWGDENGQAFVQGVDPWGNEEDMAWSGPSTVLADEEDGGEQAADEYRAALARLNALQGEYGAAQARFFAMDDEDGGYEEALGAVARLERELIEAAEREEAERLRAAAEERRRKEEQQRFALQREKEERRREKEERRRLALQGEEEERRQEAELAERRRQQRSRRMQNTVQQGIQQTVQMLQYQIDAINAARGGSGQTRRGVRGYRLVDDPTDPSNR